MNAVKIKSLLGFWCGMAGLSLNILETPAVKSAIELNNPDACWNAMVDHQSQYQFNARVLREEDKTTFYHTWEFATTA